MNYKYRDNFSEMNQALFKIILDFLDLKYEYSYTFPNFRVQLPNEAVLVHIQGQKKFSETDYFKRQFERNSKDAEDNINLFYISLPNHSIKTELLKVFNNEYENIKCWIENDKIKEMRECNFWRRVFNVCNLTKQREKELMLYVSEEIKKVNKN